MTTKPKPTQPPAVNWQSPPEDITTWMQHPTIKPALLRNDARALVVGLWTWLYFTPEKIKADEDARTMLKAAGFRYNRTRQCWQHPGGKPSRHSPEDPRGKYGQQRIKLEED